MGDNKLQLLFASVLGAAATLLGAAAGAALYVLDLYKSGGGPVVVASGEAAPNYWFAAFLVVVLPLAIGVVVFFSVLKREPTAREPRYTWR